ncbi:MAG: SGNH/GDSL hydrolase family protein [Bacteroidetes bacterium]|nr:SGNH/GDSL hydrolase family protein [Bacteroidota bacterium]MBS1931834.1 SGNH/GDSL hydrolase family protein [Bacteroidota bacterium]
MHQTQTMISKAFASLICLALSASQLIAQESKNYIWWNPATNVFPTIEGQAWPETGKNIYNRLPAKVELLVRKEVWELAKHTAGMYIKFRSNAKNIIVRYGTTNKANFAMQHMPATGVSGVDLYAIDHYGHWVWAPGKRSFGDTITYKFLNMKVDSGFPNAEYEFRLFLPLYNGVTWMEIGIPEGNTFQAIPLSQEKPIVFYGTSILQGGCASRPGLAWTSIVERKLNCPVINLGFSGNGRLEPEIIDLINEIDAQLYVLDCIPNMVHGGIFSDEELANRLVNSVKNLRQKHPDVPILLAAHSLGSFSGIIESENNSNCEKSNAVLANTFDHLKNSGVKNIYLLTSKEIGFDIDATVDGVHPNDIGMRYYADAYLKIIKSILNK